MSHARARLVYFGYRGAAALLQAVPIPVGRALAAGIALVAWATGARRRHVVAANFRRVLGPDASAIPLRRTVRRAYVNYGMYWSDGAHLDASNRTFLARRISVKNPERLVDAGARGRGLIVVVPHVGCFEAGAIWTESIGFPLVSVGELLEPPELFDWFVEVRSRVALTVLPPGAATTARLLARLRDGKGIVLVADRDVIGDGLPTEFFGATTSVPAGPAVLALRTGAAVVPVAIYLEPRGRFVIDVSPELDTTRSGDFRADVARVTQDMVRAFEKMITARPEQWHMFQPNWPDEDAATNQ